MVLPISRDEAVEFLRSMPQVGSDMNHYLMSEAIMRALALRLNVDVEYWGMVGLLHDVDWAFTKNDLEKHCVSCSSMLKELGFDEEFISTVQSHAYGMDIIPSLRDKSREKEIEHCLVASETLTGLIYAYALMRGGISDMSVKGLRSKFKSTCFAEGCDRDSIREIELAGIDLDEFFGIGIEAVKGIKDEIGLE